MKKEITLTELQESLQIFSLSQVEKFTNKNFNRKAAEKIVLAAENTGTNVYCAYHEDEADTWKSGWSFDNYRKTDSDVLFFRETWLIGKKKPARAFTKAQTYTSECCFMVFAPLSAILADNPLCESYMEIQKSKSAKHAAADWQRVQDYKIMLVQHAEKVKSYQKEIPEESKIKIASLVDELLSLHGISHSKQRKNDIEAEIKALGGRQPIDPNKPYGNDFIHQYSNVDDYQNYVWGIKKEKIHQETLQEEEAGA